MKRIFFLLTAAWMLALAACRPEAVREYQNPDSAFKISDLSGTWKCFSLMQTDEDATRKGFPYKTVDLSAAVNAPQLKFTLNMNGSNPGTFAIDHGTGLRQFASTSGNWIINDPTRPSQVWLVNGADTVKFTIQGYSNILLNRKLVLKRVRNLADKSMSTYTYSFDKQ
jgi:hypothetical protein